MDNLSSTDLACICHWDTASASPGPTMFELPPERRLVMRETPMSEVQSSYSAAPQDTHDALVTYEVGFTCLEYDGGDMYVHVDAATLDEAFEIIKRAWVEGVVDVPDPEDPEHLGTWYAPSRLVCARFYRRTAASLVGRAARGTKLISDFS